MRASAEAGGDGTKERPFKKFAQAASAKPKRVYVCGEMNGMGEVYAEDAGLAFSDGVAIYGGFTDCDGAWRWSPKTRATLEGKPDASPDVRANTITNAIALTLNGGANRLENLDVFAADVNTADDAPSGKSSIALLANEGTLDIVNATLKALNATNGAEAGPNMTAAPLDGIDGAPGALACSGGIAHVGPKGPTTQCMNGQSVGGKGGDGGIVSGDLDTPQISSAGPGGSGEPSTSEAAAGTGGDGQTDTAPCTKGADGASGPDGAPAKSSDGLGTIRSNGFNGAPAKSGNPGEPGRGGGGGGGARGGVSKCGGNDNLLVLGASGGSGGSGGCGGQGGLGGNAGGSSIALIALDAALTLDHVDLVAGIAGDGGSGGLGQEGGKLSSGGGPGTGGGTVAVRNSCPGGGGGKGGDGGPGGGGHGGHALGVALQGATVQVINPGSFSAGTAGVGGPGGGTAPDPNQNGAQGAKGLARECWDFAKNKACSFAVQ